jgi:hypothetical protein
MRHKHNTSRYASSSVLRFNLVAAPASRLYPDQQSAAPPAAADPGRSTAHPSLCREWHRSRPGYSPNGVPAALRKEMGG